MLRGLSRAEAAVAKSANALVRVMNFILIFWFYCREVKGGYCVSRVGDVEAWRCRHSSPPSQFYAYCISCASCASRDVSSHNQHVPDALHDWPHILNDRKLQSSIPSLLLPLVQLSDKDDGTMHSIRPLFELQLSYSPLSWSLSTNKCIVSRELSENVHKPVKRLAI